MPLFFLLLFFKHMQTNDESLSNTKEEAEATAVKTFHATDISI